MVGFGAIIVLVKKIAEREKLQIEIKECKDYLNRPLNEYFKNADKFHIACDIAKIEYHELLISNKSISKKECILNYIAKLEELLMSHKEELKEIPATKYDIEEIGIALQKFSLLLDGNIVDFQKNADTTIKEKTGEIDIALKAITLAHSELIKSYDQLVSSSVQKIDAEINKNSMRINAEIEKNSKRINAEIEKSSNISQEMQRATKEELNLSKKYRKKLALFVLFALFFVFLAALYK